MPIKPLEPLLIPLATKPTPILLDRSVETSAIIASTKTCARRRSNCAITFIIFFCKVGGPLIITELLDLSANTVTPFTEADIPAPPLAPAAIAGLISLGAAAAVCFCKAGETPFNTATTSSALA